MRKTPAPRVRKRRPSKPSPLEKAATRFLKKVPYLGPRLDPHRVQVTLGSLVAFFFRGADAVFGLLFNLALARLAGPAGSGIFFLALGTASTALVFGRMGIGSILMRLVAAHSSTGELGKAKGAYQKALTLAAAFSGVAALILFLAAPFLAQTVFHKPELTSAIRWASLTVVPGTLFFLQGQALRGLGLIRDSLLVDGLSVPILGLLGLMLFHWSMPGLQAALAAQVTGCVLAVLLGAWLWRRAIPSRVRTHPIPASLILQSSMPLFWVSFIGLVTSWASTFALGIWATKEEVGIYGIALRMASLVQWILFAVTQVSNPMFAAFSHKGDKTSLRRISNFSGKAMTLLCLPPALLLLAFPGPFLGLFGESFRAGAVVLQILVVGNFFKVIAGNSTPLLVMSGHEKLLRNRVLFISALAVTLNFLLVPHWGILGAAISTAVCVTLSNIITVWLVWDKLGIWTVPFLWKKPQELKK